MIHHHRRTWRERGEPCDAHHHRAADGHLDTRHSGDDADAASYTSKNPKRNDHVTSADFLDATNHPEIVFTAQAVTPSGAGYTAEGTVTIKGRTSPLELAVSDVAVDGATGSFTATATVDRKAVGVDKMPSFVIGRTLTIDIAATATKA